MWIVIGLILWIFIVIVTTPYCKMTVLFVHVWKIKYVPLNGVLYLYAGFIFFMTLSLTLKLLSILVVFSRMKSLFICACLHKLIYLQYAMWFMGDIMSQLKMSWLRNFPLSCGTWIVPQRPLLIGLPSMDQSNLHGFPVYYRFVQGFLALDVFYQWLRLPVYPREKQDYSWYHINFLSIYF